MKEAAGALPLVLLVLLLLAFNIGRQVFPRERPPAVLLAESEVLFVELGQGFVRPGVYQFSDASLWEAVISLTTLDCARNLAGESAGMAFPAAGTKLDLSCSDSNLLNISVSWMSAAKRMALGILLHPDRMTLEDWQSLPGIGPRLAERIELDRQKNGDFGSLKALQRVSGIGPKRIRDWESYFSGS
ncbi:ComEA family DNA-binding protein [Geoalkalibacter sp.]|uniref:ComEA family DNA-binding protein n=1 Tax=Geoalkalibacter sp. TaxID=3041440 RepID=UPI00272EA0C8|nr:helix-hairpin-helix domain-containing protein [Geoalkalibacter sp.]